MEDISNSRQEDSQEANPDIQDSPSVSFQSFVKESKELNQLISNIEKDLLNDSLYSRCATIIEKYQEQPHLLDPHLAELVIPLLRLARENFHQAEILQKLLKLTYIFIKVRGFRVLERFFPHEVSDFEPTLQLLQAQKINEFEKWETRYILLLWLAVLVLIPFQLSTIDSSDSGKTILNKVIDISKYYLNDAGKPRDAAAIVLSRALTRPDFSGIFLTDFFQWSIETITQSKSENLSEQFLIIGIFTTLAGIFKRGKRQELLDKIHIVYNNLDNIQPKGITDRKLKIKLTQRIGLIFLKPKIAAWRYQRGNRILLSNTSQNNGNNMDGELVEFEEDYDIPSEMEDIIQRLLDGLRDKDSIVRYSAAKGIGRICNRIPKELANDVLDSVLELFSFGETDGAWQGGCLALGELARRGLLLPNRIKDVLPYILKALQYDELKGSHSVGSHVRDAACYVCWSFARAYSPQIMQPYVLQLATGLILTALFDREINCRRAAAAAFQENVGRQGNFPYGIEIITIADYFSLANRTEAFTKISVQIAKFQEYNTSIIDHLVEVKMSHWDKNIRELTSKSLFYLTPTNPTYIRDTVLPNLIPHTTSINSNKRHGSILCIGEIIKALYEIQCPIDLARQQEIAFIVPSIQEGKLFRGKGGEYIRFSVSKLIEAIAISKISLTRNKDLPINEKSPQNKTLANPILRNREKPIAIILQETLDENLKHPSEEIQFMTVTALKVFWRNCYSFPPKKYAVDLVLRYLTSIQNDDNPAVKRGFILALGVMPREFILASQSMEKALSILISVTQVDPNASYKDAETRRNAVRVLIPFLENIGLQDNSNTEAFSLSHLQQIFEALMTSIYDYSVDNRGDVGSWVREEAILSLKKFLFYLYKYQNNSNNTSLLTTINFHRLFCALIQQSLEKLDRLRALAARTIHEIIHLPMTFVPYQSSLIEIFPNKLDINWESFKEISGKFVKLLDCDEIRESILTGMIVGIGGTTQSFVLESNNSLLEFLKALKNKESSEPHPLLVKISNCLISIFEKNQKNDRVILPLFKVLSQLLSHNCFDQLQPPNFLFSENLLNLVKNEVSKIKDIMKLMNSVYLFCWLCLFKQPTRNKSLQLLMVLLCHRFPKVRKLVADELYIRIMTDETIVTNQDMKESGSSEIVNQVLNLLAQTKWDTETITEEIKSKRDSIRSLLHLSNTTLE